MKINVDNMNFRAENGSFTTIHDNSAASKIYCENHKTHNATALLVAAVYYIRNTIFISVRLMKVEEFERSKYLFWHMYMHFWRV